MAESFGVTRLDPRLHIGSERGSVPIIIRQIAAGIRRHAKSQRAFVRIFYSIDPFIQEQHGE
jgi:hypothetical protein